MESKRNFQKNNQDQINSSPDLAIFIIMVNAYLLLLFLQLPGIACRPIMLPVKIKNRPGPSLFSYYVVVFGIPTSFKQILCHDLKPYKNRHLPPFLKVA